MAGQRRTEHADQSLGVLKSSGDGFLPYGRQVIGDDDVAAVAAVLRGDYLTTGPAVEAFEKEFCAVTGARESIVCGNGTHALHLASLAAGIGPGDLAIVPTLTFLATANGVRYCGGDVLFADVDPETGLLTPDTFEAAIRQAKASGKTPKAVFPVHLAGQTVAQAEIRAIAQREGMLVVTDACHALGTTYKGAPAGSCTYEDVAVFSFHPVKTIAMGEGGAVTTNDPALARRMRTLRTHGIVHRPVQPVYPEQGLDEEGNPNPWYYEMPELGFNYRASDIHCALGLSQLRKLSGFVEKRRALARLYDDLLAPLAPVVRTPQRVGDCDPAWHLYAARIDFEAAGLSRAAFVSALRRHNIGSQVHYLPVHRQPYYRDLYGALSLPGADHYYERTLSLPLYPSMTEDDVGRVAVALSSILNG